METPEPGLLPFALVMAQFHNKYSSFAVKTDVKTEMMPHPFPLFQCICVRIHLKQGRMLLGKSLWLERICEEGFDPGWAG